MSKKSESYFGACPACGGKVIEHSPANNDEYECWRFACYGEVLRMGSGKFLQNQPCQDAIRFKLHTINKALTTTRREPE